MVIFDLYGYCSSWSSAHTVPTTTTDHDAPAPATAAVEIRRLAPGDLAHLGELAEAAFADHPETVVTWPALRRAGEDDDAKAAEERRQMETGALLEACRNPRCPLEVAKVKGSVVGYAQCVLPASCRDVSSSPMSDASAEDEDEDDNMSNDSVTVSGDFQFQESQAEKDFEQARQPLVSVAMRFVRGESKVLGEFVQQLEPHDPNIKADHCNSHSRTGMPRCLSEPPGARNRHKAPRTGENLASEQGWRVVAVCAGDRNLRFYERLGLAF
ncbi:hypothetical protein V8F06_012872 [Rhypophila decipiens]